MIHHRRLAALGVAVVLATAACSDGPTPAPSASADQTPASQQPTGSPEPVPLSGELTLWHAYDPSGGTAEFRAFSRILERLRDANPDLELTVQAVPLDDIFGQFETEAAAGRGPDLFIAPGDQLGSEVRRGFVADLDGLIDDVIADSRDISVEGSTVNGSLYLVPESLKGVAMYYDAQAVTKAPTTTDELLTFVKDGGKLGVVGGAYFGWGFYSAFGGDVFDETQTKCQATATRGVADAMAFVKELKDAGALVDVDYGKVNGAFINGEIDIVLNGNWALGEYRAARPGLVVTPVPAGPAGPARPMVGVDGWYVNKASTRLDLAVAVAAEMVSREAQTLFVDVAAHVPANRDIQIIDPLVDSFADAIDQGYAWPHAEAMSDYWGNFDRAWNRVLVDGVDPTAAVEEACAAMDAASGS